MVTDYKQTLGQSLGTDFYLVDELLTDEERRIRDKVRAFCWTITSRHHADIEAVFTYEGTDTIQSLIVGRDITGKQVFSS